MSNLHQLVMRPTTSFKCLKLKFYGFFIYNPLLRIKNDIDFIRIIPKNNFYRLREAIQTNVFKSVMVFNVGIIKFSVS